MAMRSGMTGQLLPGLICDGTSLEWIQNSGKEELSSFRNLLKEGHVVLIKQAFPEERVITLRDEIFRWGCSTECVSFKADTNRSGFNFHRIDANPELARLPHRFHQYGFDDLSQLPVKLGHLLSQVGSSMLRLQNRMACTGHALQDGNLRIKALQYPRGAGFLKRHGHPLEPQRVGLILACSKKGDDYERGGTTFLTPFGEVDTAPHQDAGDLLMFRYDLRHGVNPIDADEALRWDRRDGRWTLVLELIQTYQQTEG